MRDHRKLTAFRRFLEKEYAVENLLFVLEVESFQSLWNETDDLPPRMREGEMKERAGTICELFIKPASDMSVNLSCVVGWLAVVIDGGVW